MLTAADYYNRIARPTVEDFYRHNSDVRLAMLACMATLHVVDHVVQNRMAVTTPAEARAADEQVMQLTSELTERHFPFEVVRAYGTASKHGQIGLQRRFQPGFDSGRGYHAPPSFAGVMVAGVSFLGDTVGGITLRWTEHGHVNLTNTLRALLPILEQEFPEIVTAPAEEAATSTAPSTDPE